MTTRAAVSPFEAEGAPALHSPIDAAVSRLLAKRGIQPARLCSDEVFLRRVFLDTIGTLPTPEEARDFLGSRDPRKRSVLVDALVRRDEFADYWALKWCDLLRVKAEFPINLWPNAAQAYHRWIRTCVRDSMPYDRFVRVLLTSSGSNFRVPPANFYRAMQGREPRTVAQAVALAFMGVRADRWPRARLDGMVGFFAQIAWKSTGEWKEEIVLFDPAKRVVPCVLPDGKRAQVPAGTDPRQVFARWLTAADNPWFARNIVNRVWYWLLGRGIVHEPDDIRPDNPPRCPELLAWLERDLVASRYDLRRTYRAILNSRTYQSSCVPPPGCPDTYAGLAYYPLRRLDAEVLIDALNQITGTTESYSSAIPEPFTFIPEDVRSIALADGSITSSFLEMFGRPARDTGLESERTNRVTAAQRLHLLNSSHVQRKLGQGPRMVDLVRFSQTPQAVVDTLYLTILSRYPTSEERKVVADYAASGTAARREAAVDLAWALVNSAEFLHRH